jgi:predicted small metal-binding protein
MAKILKCRDVGMDCDVEIRATTEEEMLLRAAEHAQTVHGRQDDPARRRRQTPSWERIVAPTIWGARGRLSRRWRSLPMTPACDDPLSPPFTSELPRHAHVLGGPSC